MLYLLYGGDEVSIEEALASLRAAVGPPDLRDVNITVFEASRVGFAELTATCATIPFLAEKRMVVVEGLLSTFDRRAPGTGARPPQQAGSSSEWEGLAEFVPGMPETTDLVLVDGALGRTNPLLAKLRPLAEIKAFPMPAGRDLKKWIGQRAASRGTDIEPGAVDALADSIGGNLRLIDMEVQKLSIYRGGQVVRRQDVEEMVAYVKDANIFAAVDAALEGRVGVAARLIHQMLDTGRAPTYLITMIARQVRLVILAKDLRSRGVAADEIGRRLSLTGYPLQKTMAQEQKLTHERLASMHRKLLDADLSLKTGRAPDEVVLDTLVAELADA